MSSSLFLAGAILSRRKKEKVKPTDLQLKYIPRQEVERIFGKSDGFPTFSYPQSLLKTHYFYIKCIVKMEYEGESSYLFIHFLAKLLAPLY